MNFFNLRTKLSKIGCIYAGLAAILAKERSIEPARETIFRAGPLGNRIISKLQRYFKRLARGFIGEGDFLLFY